MTLLPIATFEEVSATAANELLEQWSHKMGPVRRGNSKGKCHALFHNGVAVGVTTTHCLIAPNVGGVDGLTRKNAVELSRLCAARPQLCRVLLRLWREFVFPSLGYRFAISYQDANLHTGNTYRFDGWERVGFSRSGKDTRSGRAGRSKFIWVFPPLHG